VIEAGVCVRFD